MKSSVAEKRTQVYFPEKLYRDVQKCAKVESKSVAAVVREAVAKHIAEKEIDWENDPFLKLVGIMKTGASDLSVNHDHYIYGVKKRTESKAK